jgi:1-acyl-sn-glycerol-3-phosphate acyltransferase
MLGWKMNVTLPDVSHCVICVAPHTSNWDLLIGKVFYAAIGRHTYFMMKREWFTFPLGIFFRAIGGIPVNRSKKSSLVDQMVEQFKTRRRFQLAITPEGTRKPNPEWKRGFYYMALEAKVPIQLFAIDYAKKTITATRSLIPSGNLDADMVEIKNYYSTFTGKNPKNFAY